MIGILEAYRHTDNAFDSIIDHLHVVSVYLNKPKMIKKGMEMYIWKHFLIT